MGFHLPELKFKPNDIASVISGETLEFHYGRDHKMYVDNVNYLVKGSKLAGDTLEEIITKAKGLLFNNASQAWNHSFYWNCLAKENGGLAKTTKLYAAIVKQFGSFANFKAEFINSGLSLLGSGWTWLVLTQRGQLAIVNVSNAGSPCAEKCVPLLACDIWEHAYYVDYRNARKSYLEGFFKIINWQFVSDLYKQKEMPEFTSVMR